MSKPKDVSAGTPAWGRPLSPAEIAQHERERRETHEQDRKGGAEILQDKNQLADDEKPTQIELSPEERAKLEAEKRSLLAELKQDVALEKAAGPKPEARPQRAEQPVVQRDPRPADAPEADVESPLSLKVASKRIAEAVAANQALDKNSIEYKKSETRAKLQPLIDAAVVCQKKLDAFLRTHEADLDVLAPLGVLDYPASWPLWLRQRAYERLSKPSMKLLDQLRRGNRGIEQTIADAERIAEIGFHPAQGWSKTVAQAVYELTPCTRVEDNMRDVTMQLEGIVSYLREIEEQGQEYAGVRQPEVVVLLSGTERVARVGEALYKAQVGELRTRASGMDSPLP
jgi:hypothetical protein